MFWTFLAIIAAVILLFIMRRAAAYKTLFADEHFLEIAEGVGRLKTAALAQIEKEDAQTIITRDDPRVLLTKQNLRVFYTVSEVVSEVESNFQHHFSLSIAQGYTATAVGETFSLYFAYLLAFAARDFTVERSQNGVYHVEWQLTPAEHQKFARTPVKTPPREELPAIYERLHQWRREISVQQTEIPLPENL